MYTHQGLEKLVNIRVLLQNTDILESGELDFSLAGKPASVAKTWSSDRIAFEFERSPRMKGETSWLQFPWGGYLNHPAVISLHCR